MYIVYTVWGGFISAEHNHKVNAFLNELNLMDT